MCATPEDVPRGRLQRIQHGVVKDPRRRASDRGRSRGSNWSLLHAIQILRAVQRSLLHAPSQDFRPSDRVLRISVGWTQVDISKPELNDVDISVLKETEFLAERGCEA
jgi:hypothetical protein